MAKPGKSTIQKEIKFDVPLPADLKQKRVNLRWRANDLGTKILEVGFTGWTGRVGRGSLEAVEEWYDVPGGTVDAARKGMEEEVLPRVRELFEKSEDVIATLVE